MIRNLYRFVGLVVCALPAIGGTAQAEAFLGSMSPGSVVRGGTTRVELRGTELGDPLDLWTSVGGDKIRVRTVAGQASAERVVLDVAVAADCPLGLHGLRLATDDGLTNLVLFLVDDLEPVPSVPGPSPTKGEGSEQIAELKLPTAIAGTFRPAEVDRFTFVAAADEEISFECVSSRFGKDADPLIRILDERGKAVVEHDNDPGLFFDFRFAHRFAKSGRYTIELCDVRYHGDPEWSYVLRVGRFPAARVLVPAVVRAGEKQRAALPELNEQQAEIVAPTATAEGAFYYEYRRPGDAAATWLAASVGDSAVTVEAEPNDTAEQATKATVPTTLGGVLGTPGDRDFFEFELKKGDRLSVRAETAALDSPADIELALIAEDGRETNRVDDVKEEEAYFTTNAINKDGKYRLMVHDVTRGGGPAFAYRIDVRPAEPRIDLVADFADLTIPQGDYQSLPLLLTRTDFTGPVQLRLDGAPPGVKLEPDVIPEGATTLSARVRAADSAPLGCGSLRVVGTAVAGERQLTTIARVQPTIDREQFNRDLIKYALRENQKRLPPSVARCVALQVTPPPPFTVETPEPVVTLVRYLSAEFPIQVVRRDGFAGELRFKAVGGQLGEESEIRRQIYTRFTPGTADNARVVGTFYSRNLPQEQKQRVDLSSDGEHAGRRVSLVRSFELDLKAGYDVNFEPKGLVIQPGESAKFQFVATRLPPFDGPITIQVDELPGLVQEQSLTIAAGATSVDFEVKTTLETAPMKPRIRYETKAQVGQFQEESRPKTVDFEIKIPPPPKPEAKPAKK